MKRLLLAGGGICPFLLISPKRDLLIPRQSSRAPLRNSPPLILLVFFVLGVLWGRSVFVLGNSRLN